MQEVVNNLMVALSLDNQPAIVIPFSLNEHDGKVVVYYGKNDDPIKAGFDIVPDLNFEIDLVRGYPMMHARVENYSGSGYRMLCGWIQIVTEEFYPSEGGRIDKSVFVDVLPSMQVFGIPFASFGYLPQLFDAPAHNIGKHAKLRWVADTFLTTVPMRSTEGRISCITGFRWGYVEHDNPKRKPTSILPLEIISKEVWNSHVPLLEKEYNAWNFGRA
jgi:hypothetical protein